MKYCLACATEFARQDWTCPACGSAPKELAGMPAFAPELAASNDGFAEEFFPRLAAMEDGHFWFEARNELILWGMRKFVPRLRSFMEVGCGTGFVLRGVRRGFPDASLCGSEISTSGLSFAAGRLPGVPLMQMDACRVPFRSEFDAIGVFDVLEHIEDDLRVLNQLAQSLTPGGVLLITVPQHPSLWSAVDEHSFHKRRYTSGELAAKLNKGGFEPLLMTSFMTLLFPALWISRLRYRLGSRSVESGEALRIPPTINRLFASIARCERKLIQSGWRLPFGGSLFAVARRPGQVTA